MIYVDKLRPCVSSPTWRWNKSCHLFADTAGELHMFVRSLGLKRKWFQNKLSFPHYDLTENKRREAIRMGAVEKSIVEWLKEKGSFE